MTQYLNRSQVAAMLGLTPKTISNLISAGHLKEGVHFFRPPHSSRPMFVGAAIEKYIRGCEGGKASLPRGMKGEGKCLWTKAR